MTGKIFTNAKGMTRGASSFFVPILHPEATAENNFKEKRIVAIIPTYKPKTTTYNLVQSLVRWHDNVQVIVVDDLTPFDTKASVHILEKIRLLTQTNPNVKLLRTPSKQFKASALNFGLADIENQILKPDAVVTFDDDVIITRQTIPNLIKTLYAREKIGVVCSLCLVKNKKKNFLTRLQSLEYHGFNITKIGDNGFIHGPLVMQGMLSVFRYEAIKQVNGFAPDNLIEDYDITVRIKNQGWKTAIAPDAIAWTYVPETIKELWKQRIRWSYGGIIVVRDFFRQFRSIFQDVVGHSLFLSLLLLVILSFIIAKHSATPPLIVMFLVIVAVLHFILAFTFNVISLITYQERDRVDWLIKLSVVPEFAYSNMLSAILIGSYLFFVFTIVSNWAVKHFPFLFHVQKTALNTFHKLGYSGAWGTRM